MEDAYLKGMAKLYGLKFFHKFKYSVIESGEGFMYKVRINFQPFR